MRGLFPQYVGVVFVFIIIKKRVVVWGGGNKGSHGKTTADTLSPAVG